VQRSSLRPLKKEKRETPCAFFPIVGRRLSASTRLFDAV